MKRKAIKFAAIVTVGMFAMATLARAQVMAPPALPVQTPSTAVVPQEVVSQIRLKAAPAILAGPVAQAPKAAAAIAAENAPASGGAR